MQFPGMWSRAHWHFGKHNVFLPSKKERKKASSQYETSGNLQEIFVWSTDIAVNFYWLTRRYSPEDRRCCENLNPTGRKQIPLISGNVYCHVLERLQRGFGLVIGSGELTQSLTASNNNSSRIYTVYNSLRHAVIFTSRRQQCPLLPCSRSSRRRASHNSAILLFNSRTPIL
jgi:hypothetical protein